MTEMEELTTHEPRRLDAGREWRERLRHVRARLGPAATADQRDDLLVGTRVAYHVTAEGRTLWRVEDDQGGATAWRPS